MSASKIRMKSPYDNIDTKRLSTGQPKYHTKKY